MNDCRNLDEHSSAATPVAVPDSESGETHCVRTNREHYNRHYDSFLVSECVRVARDLSNLHRLIEIHTSYFGLYHDGFHRRLPGRKVIEFGFGDGLNALFMARLGADVCAVEISEVAAEHLREASARLGLNINVLCGDFRNLDIPEADVALGQAFIHHLDHDLEEEFLARVASLLRRRAGVARFVEPAVNSRVLDSLRWLIPVSGRPSRLASNAFQKWRDSDPHPPRDNSTAHFLRAGRRHFSDVTVIPIGGLERFRRLIGNERMNHRYSEWSLAFERRYLPGWLHLPLARSQVVTFEHPCVC
jgi:SAM-dependent methyltransferase